MRSGLAGGQARQFFCLCFWRGTNVRKPKITVLPGERISELPMDSE